ncbi:helix-turn-helix transcriptional regulator [Lysobacter tyrosinilyticus]
MLAFHRLRMAERLDLSRVGSERLHMVHAAHSSAQVALPAGWLSLWMPLRGRLQLESAWGSWTLANQLLVTHEGPLQGSGDAATSWLLLAGARALWQEQLKSAAPQLAVMELLTRQRACPREILRPLVQLARLLRDDRDAGACDFALNRLCAGLLADQQDSLALAERCNGRTPQRRAQTLQRLLRVRHLIERSDDSNLDLAQLANRASYSPWHLIRSYRDTFGETPSEHLARLRLARAWALVRDSALPVCEITEQLGFESQSAFCRAFKNAYGLTTTQARHLSTPTAAQIHPRPAHARPRKRAAPLPLNAMG